MADPRVWALLGAVLASFLICGRQLWLWAAAAWRAAAPSARRELLWALPALAVCGWLLTRGEPLRAGRHNLHALDFMGASFRDPAGLFGEREAAPRVLLALWELPYASFGWLLLFQRLCWLLSSALVFALLRRAGSPREGAAFGAGLFLFSPHALLLAGSFAPDPAALLLLLLAFLLVAGYAGEADDRRRPQALAAACAGCFLAFLAKFEFGLAAGWGLLVALAGGRWKDLRGRGGAAAAAAAAGALLFLSVSSRPSNKLLPFEPLGPAALLRSIGENLDYQLVSANLGPLLGDGAARLLLLALCAGGLAAARRSRLWAPWLLGSVFLLGALYPPMSVYPLSHARHHLFVFLPVLLGAGLLAGEAARRLGRPAAAALGAALAAYGALGVGRLHAARGELRTHDRELQFLVDARAAWPADCAAAPLDMGPRAPVLAKYFPSGPRPCRLAYLPPTAEVHGGFPMADPGPLPAWRSAEWAHASFTDSHGPWDWERWELLAPVPVAAAFLRVPDGAAPPAPPVPGADEQPARWARQCIHPLDALYLRSAEHCYKSALSRRWDEPAAALACFDEAVADALARGDVEDQTVLRASRAAFLQGMGRPELARADADGAAAHAAAAGYRGRGLARLEFVRAGLSRGAFDTITVVRKPR